MSGAREFISAGPSEAGWHRTSDILTCPRKFALSHLTGVKQPLDGQDALLRGILWHTALAHLYAWRMDPWRWMPVPEAIDEACKREPLLASWRPAVLHTLAAYVKTWGDEARWEVLEVETEWRARLPLPRCVTCAGRGRIDVEEVGPPGSVTCPTCRGEARFLYTQRPDLVIADRRTDLVYVVDHKGTYAIVPKTTNRYALDGQVGGYHLLGRAKYGDRWGGVILNFASFGNDTGNGGKPPQFRRPELPYAPGMVDDIKATIIHAERTRRSWLEWYGEDADAYPGVFRHGDPCMTAYGPCPFFERCARGKT